MKFELFVGTNGQWHWHVVSPQGDVLAIGAQRYPDRDSVVDAIQRICGLAPTAEIWEISPGGVKRLR